MVASVEFLPQGELRMLDRYQLIGEIASGGMATVFLARLAGVGGFSRLVAIKRLHPHLASEQEFVEMFLDEARLAAGIHHPNVVGLKEIGTSDGGYYLVMDYIEGVTLATLLTELSAAKRRLPIPVVLRLLVDTLSGLHAAHELVDESTGAPLGVVHRDCTPQNILVGMDGSARLTDFGIARATSRIANTRDGSMKGKLAYMAPEQTKGDGIDRRADLFSVGVMMWEALSGRRLFRGSTEAETLRRLLAEPIPTLLGTASIHQSLSDVCAVALEREPAERFQTAVQMIEAIEEAAREWGKATGEEEPIAPVRSVAALMKEIYEAEANEQRESVRRWLQASSPLTASMQGLPVATGSLPGLIVSNAPVDSAVLSAPGVSLRRTGVNALVVRTGDEDETEFYERVTTVPDEPVTAPSAPPGASAPPSALASAPPSTQPSFERHNDSTPAPTSKTPSSRPTRLSVVRPRPEERPSRKWLPFAVAASVAIAIAVVAARPETGPMRGEDAASRPSAARGTSATDGVAAPTPTEAALDPVPSASIAAVAAPEVQASADGTEPDAPTAASASPSAAPAGSAAALADKPTVGEAKLAPPTKPSASPAKPTPAPKPATAPRPAPRGTPAPASKPASPARPAGGDDLANPYR